MRRLLALLLLSLSLLAAAVPRSAATPPAFVSVDVPEARLAGEGEFSWFGLRIYQAWLWVGPLGYQEAMPETAPFVLELRYARSLDGGRIAEASVEQMQKIGAGTPQQRQAWLDLMQRIFPDVKEGQRIAAAWRAGVAPGLRFYLDGKVLADVPDGDLRAPFLPSGCRRRPPRPSCAAPCCATPRHGHDRAVRLGLQELSSRLYRCTAFRWSAQHAEYVQPARQAKLPPCRACFWLIREVAGFERGA